MFPTQRYVANVVFKFVYLFINVNIVLIEESIKQAIEKDLMVLENRKKTTPVTESITNYCITLLCIKY